VDILVIAKKSFDRNDVPYVVYCGQSRDEAHAAVQAAAGQYARFYFADPEPHIPIRTPDKAPGVRPEAVAVAAPKPISKKTKS